MSRAPLRGRRVGWVTLVVLPLILGCASNPRSGPRSAVAVADGTLFPEGRARSGGMLLVHEAQLQLEVKDVEAAAHQIAAAVELAGGYPEDLRIDVGKGAVMVFRVPASALDATLARLETHGRVKNKRVSARNITDQAIDLQARVDNLIALRGRLREQLGRTVSLDDALRLEEQLARLQTQIDELTGRLETLHAAAELATLTVTLDRPVRLGPLAWAGNGLVHLTSKLFVLRD